MNITKKEFEQLRKNVQSELQRNIKNEYTIYQTKQRINNLFKVYKTLADETTQKVN